MRNTTVLLATAALVGGLSAGTTTEASAADEVTLYGSDIEFCDSPDYNTCEPNDITSHVLRRDGIRLTSTSYAGYTSGTFALNTTLSEVTDAAMEWYNKPGSTGEPGIRITGDFDGDGTDDTLWGESIYGDDWWLNDNSSDAVKDAAPETSGGSGSPWHGTLADWAAEFPDGVVHTGGYTLGVPGDGVLRSLTYAGTTYSFTSDDKPVPVARPKARAAIKKVGKRAAKVTVTAKQPKETRPTKKGAHYRVVKVNPRTDRTTRVAQGRAFAGERDVIRVRFPKATKPMVVKVLSYGEAIAKKRVRIR